MDLQTRASARLSIRALLRRFGGDELGQAPLPLQKTERHVTRSYWILRPLRGRLINVRAGRFGSAGKIGKIVYDIQRFIALGINGRFFGVVARREPLILSIAVAGGFRSNL